MGKELLSAEAIRIDKLESLLRKHGICESCGELFEHHYSEPFASCQCGTAEWVTFTPHMESAQSAFRAGQALSEKKDG